MGSAIEWPVVAERLKTAFQDPYKTFGLPEMTKKLMENQKSNKKGNNKRLRG